MPHFQGHAIIIGGGFGGLVTGRILSDYFDKVTIIENDSLSDIKSTEPRPGVPQGKIAHHLLFKGAEILEQWFPHLQKTLVDLGAKRVEILHELRFYELGWMPHFHNEHYTYLVTRPCLEEGIRAQMKNYPNIEFLYGAEAHQFLADFKNNRLTGVRVKNRVTNEQSNLYGEFFVDASGVNTHCVEWLEQLGFSKPEKREAKLDIYYHTQTYRPPKGPKPEWKMMVVHLLEGNVGIITEIEDDAEGERIMITQAGQLDGPLTTLDEYKRFARQLGRPEFYEVLEKSTPLTPIEYYKFPAIRRFLYESYPQLPDRFIAIGDALSKWNPEGAIGMNICTLTCEILQKVFAESDSINHLNVKFFKRASKFLDKVWTMGVESPYSRYESAPSLGTRFIRWYLASISEVAVQNPKVWETKYGVYVIDKPMVSIFHPMIVFKVLWHSIKSKFVKSEK